MNEATLKAIEQLAAKLGATSEHVWNVLIRQAHIDGLLILPWLIVEAVLFAIYLRWFCCNYRSFVKSDDGSRELGFVILAMLGGLLAFLLRQVVICFLSPEYWALKELLL